MLRLACGKRTRELLRARSRLAIALALILAGRLVAAPVQEKLVGGGPGAESTARRPQAEGDVKPQALGVSTG